MANTANAQQEKHFRLNLGDTTPSLHVREWLKGKPIAAFEKGKVYVVEFWATWCRPCIQSMPYLSTIASKYKQKVTILAIDVYEKNATTIEWIKDLVDKMGNRINFTVAVDDSGFMAHNWLEASGENSIPNAFIVNAQGNIVWIGHPKNLENVLSQIVNGTWKTENALTNRNFDKYIDSLDANAYHTLNTYNGNPNAFVSAFYGNPDSALLMIDEIVKKEPALKYAPQIAGQTFYSLLKINPNKAYEYGKIALVEKKCYDAIINSIEDFPYKYNTLPEKIFELGAEAYQAKIKNATYPLLVKTPKNYFKMAEWYLLANNKKKAKSAMRKAIKTLKKKGRYIE